MNIDNELKEALKGGVCPCHWVIGKDKNGNSIYCKETQKKYGEFCKEHTKEFLKKVK